MLYFQASVVQYKILFEFNLHSRYLHYIHVMAYDIHGSWDGVTGENAPLYPSSVDTTAAQKLLNVVSRMEILHLEIIASKWYHFADLLFLGSKCKGLDSKRRRSS